MHIHLLGIAGTKTAPLAVNLKNQGHFVSGSDQLKIYPPVSTILEKADISINNTPINHHIDLAIIGNSYLYFENTKREFSEIQKLKIPYISYTDYLINHLIKPNSILVAGSYGKTTITGLLSYIFSNLKLDPSYMFGGEAVDNLFPTRFGHSDWSIIEADENHNGLDTQTTFLYYPVKYLIITSTEWEHKDSFSSAQENLNAYRQLIRHVPKNGLIIYNGHDSNLVKIIKSSQAKIVNYQNNQIFDSKLIGFHNQQNIAAAFTLCSEIGLNTTNVLKAISTFSGIKRRLELIGQKNNVLVYDDFAQSATRVKSALEALKYSYPQHQLKIYFEPHASFLQNRNSIKEFEIINNLFSDFVLGKISFSRNTIKTSRVTARDWQNVIPNLRYFPLSENIIKYYSSSLKSGDILIHFSSGGLEGLNNLKTVYNLI